MASCLTLGSHDVLMVAVSIEETYDYTYFDNQVLEFNFPGHPAPPLGMWPKERLVSLRAIVLTLDAMQG